MFSISINRLFPFTKLIKFLLFLSIILQCIINSYIHLSGYIQIDNLFDFFGRLVYGALLTTIASLMLAYPDLFIIRYLNKPFPWEKKCYTRIPLQLLLSIILAIIVSTFITLLANFFIPYKVKLLSVLIINALIFSVLNIILMILFEAWILHLENRNSQEKTETLEKELALIRFEVLKSQINPHFLFNSLNVLSGLVSKDVDKAQLFIDEFSAVYRYVLETIEKQVVTLGDELGFMRSYMLLQQIRYGKQLQLTVNVSSMQLQKLLPPLCLHLVLENAIKHNEISQEKPLKIDIYCEDQKLVVKNLLQSKFSYRNSTGLGQKNLVKRYELIREELPSFAMKNQFYIVKLPLIDTDEYEYTDC